MQKHIRNYIIIVALLIVLCASFTNAYCNETRVVTTLNSTAPSSDYNVTITKDCTEEYNNPSFFMIGLVFIFFTILVTICLFFVKKVWLKAGLAIALSILVTSLLRFSSWFVTITNPLQINLIDTLDHFYSWGVWGVYATVLFAMIVLLVVIINTLRNKNSERGDGWENWGSE